jgi:hypothetical protein
LLQVYALRAKEFHQQVHLEFGSTKFRRKEEHEIYRGKFVTSRDSLTVWCKEMAG